MNCSFRHQTRVLAGRVAGALLVSAACAAPASAYQAWSSVGSTGTIDEASTKAAAMNLDSVTFKANATLPQTITVRYPINNQWAGEASPTWLGVRYLDNGPNARVVVMLKKQPVAIVDPAVTLATFDSDSFASSPNVNFRWTHVCPLEALDFIANSYWIEAQITKTSEDGKVRLSMVRMDNFADCAAAATEAAQQRLSDR